MSSSTSARTLATRPTRPSDCAAGPFSGTASRRLASAPDGPMALSPAEQSLGRVGRVASVRAEVLDDLLENGYTPVVASVAPGSDGGFLNINADAAAAALASSLHAAKLVYLTNVPGLYADFGDDGSLLSELDCERLQAMLPGLSAGMRPKASSAVDALQHGVGKVHILDGRVQHALLLEIFTDEGIGTQVLP